MKTKYKPKTKNKERMVEMNNWKKYIPQELLRKMLQYKLKEYYERPSFLDTVAKMLLCVSERTTCLFYDVGAVIFKGDQVLSFGYNGPSKGDDHCTDVGCARIIDGKIRKGAGKCRGSHGELNAIGNAANNGIRIKDSEIMITFRPCFSCAKQIVNMLGEVKNVYYLFEYDGDDDVKNFLYKQGVKLQQYESNHLTDWIKKFQRR